MSRLFLGFILATFFPWISFAVPLKEKTERYLSDLEQEIKQDMNNTNDIKVSSSSNIPIKEIGKNHTVIEKSTNGNFGTYFRTIQEKKHPLVDFYIQYYSTFGRKKLEEALVRLKEYFPVIFKYANQVKLPLEAVIIPIVENGAKLNSIKVDRAGMWQLPISTAKIYNLRIDDYTDERLDIEKSTKAALTHFSSLREAFNGNWDLALTAFNGGGAYFNQKIRSLGIEDFWKLLEYDTEFSSDTLEYVPKFYAILTLLKHPKTYNINVPQINSNEVKFTDILLDKSGVAFKDIAKLTNMSVEDITRLNPQLSRQFTVKGVNLYIPANTKYLMKSRIRVAKAIRLRYLPYGKGSTAGNISSTPRIVAKKSKRSSSMLYYKIRPNDTLYGIAKNYNVSVDSILSQNGLSRNSILQIGKVIKIAKGKASSKVAKATPTSSKNISYIVRAGDTIYSIAKNYNVPMDKITNHNNGQIRPGDRLIILK